MRILLALVIACVTGMAVTGCISDEITTSGDARLAFSTDTVSFDTVFTDLGTPTARLKVYNRGKKGVSISQIRFQRPDSRFAMNVDGVSGREFKDVEIRGGDSIFIFIECFIPEQERNTPVLVEDKLEFLTNGNLQEVTVEAYGQNVKRLRDFTVEGEMTLGAEIPYVIFGDMCVNPGSTLKIEPGARILFHDKASLTVRGTLEAVGAPGRLIEMRGDRLDDVLPDVGYDILSGQWQGIRISAESFGNRMEYVDMRSTKEGLVVDSTANVERQKLTLVNSWLHNSEGNVLTSKYARVDAYGCIFSEAAGAVVELSGGVHGFSQCTLANYYLFSIIGKPLLTLNHVKADEDGALDNPNPLMRAHIDNCIIYGLGSDIMPGDLDGSDVYVRYTLFKTEGSDDEHFQNCVWGADPLFETIREDYYFNYRLQEDSPAIDAGNPALIAPETMSDIDGVGRLSQWPRPALGAYAN